jgi:hypothetical protein
MTRPVIEGTVVVDDELLESSALDRIDEVDCGSSGIASGATPVQSTVKSNALFTANIFMIRRIRTDAEEIHE